MWFGIWDGPAKSVVQPLLYKEILSSLAAEQQAYYLQEDISLMEQLEAIEFMSPQSRQNFIASVYDACFGGSELFEFILETNDFMLHYTGADEKISIGDQILASAACNPFAGEVLHSLFRSCQNLEELTKVVNAIGKDRLLSIPDTGIEEFIAHAEIGNKIRSLNFPKKIKNNS